jgi:hypothetical protein
MGVYRLEDGKVEKVLDASGAYDMEIGPDGAIWLANASIFKIQNGKGELATQGYVTDLAIGTDGVVWAAGTLASKKFGKVVGREWKDEPLPEDPPNGFEFIGIDAKNNMYAATHTDVYRRKDGAWEKLDLKKLLPPGPRGFRGFRSGPGGAFYIIEGSAILSLGEDGAWSRVDAGNSLIFSRVTVSASGDLAAQATGSFAVVSPKKKPEQRSIESVGIKAGIIESFALDGQGRRWLGTDNGLVILSPKGEVLQHWKPGSLPSTVKYILVIGAGPALPAAPPEPVMGSMKGTIVREGKPVAGVDVEICDVPTITFAGRSPCSASAVNLAVKTDAQGAFRIANVPQMGVGFAFGEKGKWLVRTNAKCCTQLTQGGEVDVGEIELKK